MVKFDIKPEDILHCRILRKILGRKHSVDNQDKIIECKEVIEESGGRFIVHSVEELFWVAMMVNEKGYNFIGKTVELADDLDLRGYKWVPIGHSLQNVFSGIFDGRGKCIRGVKVETDQRYAGFFGVVMGMDKLQTAEVRDLYLSNIQIEGVSLKTYAGGLIGYAMEGVLVEKCLVAGLVESKYCAGGIVGYAEDCVSVRRCLMQGKVIGKELWGTLVCCLTENSTLVDSRSEVTDLYDRPEECLVGEHDDSSLISGCCA